MVGAQLGTRLGLRWEKRPDVRDHTLQTLVEKGVGNKKHTVARFVEVKCKI